MEKVKLNKHYIWDILEVDWSEVKVTFKGKVINLPKSITVRLWDKFRVRQMMESQPILFHLMLKQGFKLVCINSGKSGDRWDVKLNNSKMLSFSEKWPQK